MKPLTKAGGGGATGGGPLAIVVQPLGMPPARRWLDIMPFDIQTFNRRVVLFGAFAAVIFICVMSYDYWYIHKPLVPENHSKGDLPFEVSSNFIIFETQSGGAIRLKPRRPFPEKVEIQIVLDDPYVINTLGSVKIDDFSTRNFIIPLHSKNMAGHCTITFKTDSKLPELKNLFKQQIIVKVVHQIAFGYLSIAIGWIYFVAWSLCYYPQIYKNWLRQSVVGFSFDYLALNCTGHICYLVFNAAMFYNSEVQKQYTKLHPRGELPVKANDILFSCHAVSMNIVLILQCCMYERADQRVSVPMWTLVGGLWFTILGTGMMAVIEKITWLQYLYYLSYLKVGTTPIKYSPQIYLHYVSKSTEGWSIHGVMFDVFGGLFSLLQMTIDALNNDDIDGTWGNPGKLGLALMALLYDSLFLTQHFLCYPPSRKRKTTECITESSDENEHNKFYEKLDELKASFSVGPAKIKAGDTIDL